MSPIEVENAANSELLALAGGPSEGTQDQNPVFVEPTRHVLFGHQVHTVVQGADHTEIGHPPERGQGDRRQVVGEVHDR